MTRGRHLNITRNDENSFPSPCLRCKSSPSLFINERCYTKEENFPDPLALDSLFLRDCDGDEEVVLLQPPSSSSLGSVFISGFFSSTSIGSCFSSGSSFFIDSEPESSSVYKGGEEGRGNCDLCPFCQLCNHSYN